MTGRTRLVVAGGAAGLGVLLTGCVDHESNAREFCERNVELLDPARDEATYTEDQAVFFSDEVEKTMKYAEDATREVRRTARRLADAYADIRSIAGDDDVPQDEIDEDYAELREQRAEMREICAEVLA